MNKTDLENIHRLIDDKTTFDDEGKALFKSKFEESFNQDELSKFYDGWCIAGVASSFALVSHGHSPWYFLLIFAMPLSAFAYIGIKEKLKKICKFKNM